MMDKLERMKELAAVLKEASRLYYQESSEMMSNLEYDRLYDELLSLERRPASFFQAALRRVSATRC